MYHAHFAEIQSTIDNGFCFVESDYELSFLWVKDNIRPEIFFLIIKTDRNKKELWLVSFYRIRKPQFTKKLKLLAIIREHIEQEFMG